MNDTFAVYLETAGLVEKVRDLFKKKVSAIVRDNFLITDSGENSKVRYRVWSLAEKHPKVIATGGPFELDKLMERYYVDKDAIFKVA